MPRSCKAEGVRQINSIYCIDHMIEIGGSMLNVFGAMCIGSATLVVNCGPARVSTGLQMSSAAEKGWCVLVGSIAAAQSCDYGLGRATL